MGKSIPFGPGHPDYDNQLDLFDQDTSPSYSDSWPKHRTCLVPCPWCNNYTSLAAIQIAASMSDQDPVAVPGNRTIIDPACLLCEGKAQIKARLIKVDGMWWDRVERKTVNAESFEKAQRKMNNCEPLPFYVEHGGLLI